MDSKLIEYFLQRGYILSVSQLQNKIIGSCVLKQQETFLDFVEVINSKDLIECFSGLVEVLEQYSYSYQTNYLPLSGLYQTSVMNRHYQDHMEKKWFTKKFAEFME